MIFALGDKPVTAVAGDGSSIEFVLGPGTAISAGTLALAIAAETTGRLNTAGGIIVDEESTILPTSRFAPSVDVVLAARQPPLLRVVRATNQLRVLLGGKLKSNETETNKFTGHESDKRRQLQFKVQGV